jgi:hypothetical protein
VLDTAKRAARRLLDRAGIDVGRLALGDGLTPAERATLRAVEPYTCNSPQRVVAVCDAVRYLVAAGIPGAIVECGVWRGGSMMAAARTLLELGERDRPLFLYDTFAGMTAPTDDDVDAFGRSARERMRGSGEAGAGRWLAASADDVRKNMGSTGYPSELCSYVIGPVEETLPRVLPGPIALLRLDTDWYESTAHELEHLFPLIVPGGVLIIDDYGHWRGARRAVDEYLARRGVALLFARTDYTGRLAVLPRGGG